MTDQPLDAQARQTLLPGHVASLLDLIPVGMMTTVETDGSLHSRPMETLREPGQPFDGSLWFFTRTDAVKTAEISHDHHVSLSYGCPEKNDYVCMSGTAMIVRDRNRAQTFWKPSLKTWFPKGLDDPELALVRIEVSRVQTWENGETRSYALDQAMSER